MLSGSLCTAGDALMLKSVLTQAVYGESVACRVRKGRSMLFSGKNCHLVLLGHGLYCYPIGSNKPPFSELDLSASAALSVSNNTTFTIKDQTWTTYSFQAASVDGRNTWLAALRQVPGLSRYTCKYGRGQR